MLWFYFTVIIYLILCISMINTLEILSPTAAIVASATTQINSTIITYPSINETIAAIPSKLIINKTIDWPRTSSGKRFTGIKEFVIVLHDNLQWEKKELTLWYANILTSENTTLMRNLTLQHHHINQTELQPILKRMRKIRKKMQEVYNSVKIIKKHIKHRQKVISGAQITINRTDNNWNITISAFRNQYDAVTAALVDIKAIHPILKGKHPAKTVASMLRHTQGKSTKIFKTTKKSKVHTLLNSAIQASSTAKGTKEIQQLIIVLEKDLITHGAKLKAHLETAIASRLQHLALLNKKIAPYLKIIKMLHHMVNVSMATIPDYKSDLIKALNSTRPILGKMQALSNQMQQSKDRLANAKRNYVREMANILARADVIESYHQIIKNKLLGANLIDQTTLYSVTNILRPYAMTSMQWNPYYPKNLSDPKIHDNQRPYGMRIPDAINPFYHNESSLIRSCGNWQFNEPNGNPYVIDSSGNGHDGVLHGGLYYRIPKTGGLQFDGMQQYVDVGKLGDVGTTFQQFSVDLWIKTLDTHPALSTIMKYIDNTDKGVFAIEANRRVGRTINGIAAYGEQKTPVTDYESGSTMVYLRDFSGKILAGHVRAPYFDNKWHRLSFIVLNATQNKMAFYMDGKLMPWIATIEQSPDDFRKLQSNLFIGAGNNRGTPEGFFDGALRGVRLLCGSKRISFGQCCRVCNMALSKPCGDMCIANNIECHLPKGCACASSPEPTAQPTNAPTPMPTPKPSEQPVPVYPRGSTPLNGNSIFPGEGVMIPQTIEKHPYGEKRSLQQAN